MIYEMTKILITATSAFLIAVLMTPFLDKFLHKHRLGKQIRKDANAPIYTALHKQKEGTPTMGGILIWLSVAILIFIFWIFSKIAPGIFPVSLNFLTREQTYLPFAALIFAALLGALDDLAGIFKIGPNGGGLTMRHRIVLYLLAAGLGAYWFYFKLGWTIIHIPLIGDFEIGFWYIFIFIFAIVASAFSANETDGLDGLAAGVLMLAFSSFSVIAFLQGKIELAMFCSAIIGALLAFLWFNVYPARFFMGDTGSMSLGITLGVIAMLTNSFFLLPFVGFILVMESLSVILQMISKKVFGRKIFLSTPIHHHFEALGWPETKVTMRFWIISAVASAVGLIIFFFDRQMR